MAEKPKRKWIPLAGEVEDARRDVKPEVVTMRPLFFKGWFNDRTLSDLVLHTSKDSDARKYFCHKFIISCSCPVLYDSLMATKFESTSDPELEHVLLVDPLTDKDEQMITSFFQVLYNTNLVKDEAIKPSLFNLAQLYQACGATDIARTIMDADGRIGSAFAPNIDKYRPKRGQDTPLSDFTLYFNKEKSIFLKVHRIMLANYSSYFRGLFKSGMKDSNTHEAMISLEIDLKPEEIAVQMEALLSYIYDRRNLTLFLFVTCEAERMIAMNCLASKYFFEEMISVTENYIKSYPVMEYIRPALKYDNQLALMSSTKALVEVILSVDLTRLPVDYLNVVRYTDNQNLFHAIVENQFQPGSEPRIRQIQVLQKHLGSAAQIKITDLDDENNSCLHYACREVEDNQALIALLIKEKLDLNAVNNDKQRPLEIALQSWLKTSYVSAGDRAEKRRKKHISEFILDIDSDEDDKKIEARVIGVDELILAGAKVDLSNKENVRILSNFLCFASSFDNSRSKECWTKITEQLLTVPKEKISQVMDKDFTYLFLQEKYKYPIKFFFEQLNLPYKVKAQLKEGKTVKEILVEAQNTTEITVNGKSHKVKGMKVVIDKTTFLTRLNQEINNYVSFTVSTSSKKYVFSHTNDALALFEGLVSYVNGPKNVTKKSVPRGDHF